MSIGGVAKQRGQKLAEIVGFPNSPAAAWRAYEFAVRHCVAMCGHDKRTADWVVEDLKQRPFQLQHASPTNWDTIPAESRAAPRRDIAAVQGNLRLDHDAMARPGHRCSKLSSTGRCNPRGAVVAMGRNWCANDPDACSPINLCHWRWERTAAAAPRRSTRGCCERGSPRRRLIHLPRSEADYSIRITHDRAGRHGIDY